LGPLRTEYSLSFLRSVPVDRALRVELLLRTDGGYPNDEGQLGSVGPLLTDFSLSFLLSVSVDRALRVDLLLRTDSGYPNDEGQ